MSAQIVPTYETPAPPRRPARFARPGPEAVIVQRCVRHPGVELVVEVDPAFERSQDTGLRCPIDGLEARVWEVWHRGIGRRLWLADAEDGAHPNNPGQAAEWSARDLAERNAALSAQPRPVPSSARKA